MKINPNDHFTLDEWTEIFRPHQDHNNPEDILLPEDAAMIPDGYCWSQISDNDGIYIVPGYTDEGDRFYTSEIPYSYSTLVVEVYTYNRMDGIQETLDEFEISIKRNLAAWTRDPIPQFQKLKHNLINN